MSNEIFKILGNPTIFLIFALYLEYNENIQKTTSTQ